MMKTAFGIICILFVVICLPTFVFGQSEKFQEEVDAIVSSYQEDHPEDVVLFTGSSSVRLWKTLKADFPDAQVVNTGFGGSTMSDLLYYAEPLILDLEPKRVFIYEGDNDIFEGKPVGIIQEELEEIIDKIFFQNSQTQIFLISTKPSPSRWELKNQYELLNEQLELISESDPRIFYLDVWTPMLNKSEEPRKELFVEDMLHMNSEGYKIWTEVVTPYINSPIPINNYTNGRKDN